jgi:hypothetical protein
MVGSHRRAKRDPAADLFDRWVKHHDETEGPADVAEPSDAPEAESEAPPARSAPPPAGASTNVEFTPRTQARRVIGQLLLVALAGAAVAGYAVYRDPTTLTIGVAATLGVLVLVLWAVRASSATAHLSVHAGQLEVVRGGGRFVFELAGSFTPIEVVGTPGDHNWKVLFLRRNMDPFVVDSSMVDPYEFMDVLRRYLPE